jgi:parvulin-like peptidyl-prolyl isomerase
MNRLRAGWWRLWLGCMLPWLAMESWAKAQEPAAAAPAAASPKRPPDPRTLIVARVGGQDVLASEVLQIMLDTLQGRKPAANMVPQLEAQSLEQTIQRRLLALNLEKKSELATPAQVDALLNNVRQQLTQQKVDLKRYLEERFSTEELMRKQLLFDLSWGNYVKKEIGEDDLEAYFNAHRKDWDGTEVRASQVLLRIDGPQSKETVDATLARAKSLREQIESGKLSFAEAAVKHSIGPSRRKGGDVGFFPRHGRMIEEFSKAAFELEKGKISEPVGSQFGVHLIQVTDEKPGKKTWKDSVEQLKALAAQELYRKLVEEERAVTPVEYTGAMTYIKPGTRELVVPSGPGPQPLGEGPTPAPDAPAETTPPTEPAKP